MVPFKPVTQGTVEQAVAEYAHEIESFDIPSDGLVLLMDDSAYGCSLGRTAKFPRNSIAFKWQDETANTPLTEAEWSPSRTGVINNDITSSSGKNKKAKELGIPIITEAEYIEKFRM